MALTDKKRRFADALLSGTSNREAAIAAGYSEKTASQAGSKLAKDPDVLAAMGRQIRRRDAAKEKVKPELKVNSSPLAADEDAEFLLAEFDDPRDFLLAVMNEQVAEPRLRVEAAKTLMPYVHGKVAEQGKKVQKADAAKKASTGRFGQGAPPRLAVDNTR